MTTKVADWFEKLWAQNETELECRECGVVYTTSLARATCGEEACVQRYLKRHGYKEKPKVDPKHREALRWRAANIPAQYDHAELSQCDTRLGWTHNRASIRLHGGNGRGKTHLAVALLKAAIRKNGRGYFIPAAQYLKRVRSTYRPNARESEQEVLDEFAGYHCLVIDDIGVENKTDSSWAELITLIEERAFRDQTTIITTNKTLAEIHAMEPRLASRLREWRFQDMTGPDRRAFPDTEPARERKDLA